MTTFILVLLSLSALADEPIHPRQDILNRGYREQPVPPLRGEEPALPFAPHAVPWPVRFKDAQHSMGNTMAQFQPFGEAYWHGGCDLRVARRAPVVAPVGGWVEAGHYDYAHRPDGTLQKFWKPWPQNGDATYFEVAIVTDEAFRFELHHMDRSSLPTSLREILNRGGGRIEAGSPLGTTIPWSGTDYDHIHYNIISPTDVRVNPEFASPLIVDTLPPRILDAWVQHRGSATVHPLVPSSDLSQADAVYVRVAEQKDQNIYVAPPVFAELRFENGATTRWDFRQRLLTEQPGQAPHLFEFYAQEIRTDRGQRLRTEGGYGTGPVIVRLRVPPDARGTAVIRLQDPAGNETRIP